MPPLRYSKVRAPRHEHAVERPRLLRQLTSASDAPIVLISAAGGYGKSTLAAQWAAGCGRPATWINLDHGHNDPIVFLSDFAHALDLLDPVAPELFDELSTMAPRVEEVVLPALATELARLAPLELILDDVHELSGQHSLALLESLLGEIPAGSQVVLVSRRDPELPLARRRAAGDLVELRAEHLTFDAREARALTTLSGADLSEPSLERLRERTEGWPAGMVLALQALRGSASGDGVLERISGPQRAIADYFAEVIVAEATEERQRFLLATSVLRRMSAPLCDAVLGTTGSRDELLELERSNSFLIPLDDQRGWYRYHHLFGELLRAELDRSHPELAATYLARAAEWHERDGGDPEEAFRCARECGDFAQAGRVAATVADTMVNRGQVETLRLWLEACSDDEIASDPQLAIVAGWTELLLGGADRVDRAQRFINAAEQGELDVPCAAGATSVRSWLAILRGTLAPHGIHQMLDDARSAYATEQAAGSPWTKDCCLSIGTAYVLLGDTEQAIGWLQRAVLLFPGPELAADRAFVLAYLAFAAADAGRWADARKWAREGRADSAEHHLDHTIQAVPGLLVHALVLAHDGDTARAALELDHISETVSPMWGVHWFDADINVRWGNLSLDLGDRVAAGEHADLARAALHDYPDPGTLPARLAELDARIARADDLHLTAAELRILPFLPTHLSVKEIAGRLHLSRATVKTHVSSIYNKLGVSTRSEAVERMEQFGMH
ncbi:MAG: LuxR C-terminal-related transcriptional regulator [Gaiella sp.]|nr:LuxR C-terminal-related transcriptional regulator [Gaiella sp.]